MEDLRDVGAPLFLGSHAPPGDDPESLWLGGLDGVAPRAPRVWVPAQAEAAFHLETRLEALFEGVVDDDPDEDEIEEIAPEARSLLAGHVLLDAWVDAFYDACRPLGPRVRVRRPGEAGREATNGRPALLAVRAAWASAWSDDALLDRLRAGGGVRPVPRPLMVHAADAAAPEARTEAVRAHLGAPLHVFVEPDGGVTRLLRSG